MAAMKFTPQALRALRIKQNPMPNQKEFWEPVGVTQSGGSRYESGRTVPVPVRKLLVIVYGNYAEYKNMLRKLRGRK